MSQASLLYIVAAVAILIGLYRVDISSTGFILTTVLTLLSLAGLSLELDIIGDRSFDLSYYVR